MLDLIALPALDPGSAPYYADLFGVAILAAFALAITWEFRRQLAAEE